MKKLMKTWQELKTQDREEVLAFLRIASPMYHSPGWIESFAAAIALLEKASVDE